MEENNLGEKIKKIIDSVDDELLENASNEELMTYLFMIEKFKTKLEKIAKLDEK